MADDYPNNSSTNGYLWYGLPGLHANLEAIGDEDWFQYLNQLSNPDAVTFVLSDAQFDVARIFVRDQSLNVVASFYGRAADALLSFQGQPNLSYFVSVEGYTFGGALATGSYTISTPAIVDDHKGDTTTTATIVVDGAPATGVIELYGDEDWFRIEGVNGENIRVTVASAEFDSVLFYVRNAAGANIYNYLGPVSGASLVAGPGAYFVSVIGASSTGAFDTGAYSLVATSVPDDHGDTIAAATTMTVGGPPVTAINEGGDFDYFSFRAEAGVPIVFDWLSFPESTPRPSFTLYDQYGRSVSYGTQSVSGDEQYFVFTPTISGAYYMAVQAGQGTSTFQIVEATDDYGETLSTNGVLTMDGGPLEARLDYVDDLDVFAIDIDESGAYRFEIGPLGILIPYKLIALYDEDGDLVSYRFVGFPGQGLTLQVDSPGRFYLSVEGPGTNQYWVNAYSTTDDYSSTLATAAHVDVGGAVFTGAINHNEDVDWIRFEVNAGDVIRIAFAQFGFHAYDIKILNDEGVFYSRYALDSSATSDEFFYSFTEGGTYFLSIGEPQNAIGTGSYSFELDIVPSESAFPGHFTVGMPSPGTLTYAGNDADTYEFTALAGQTIRFRVTDANFFWYLNIWRVNAEGITENLTVAPLASNTPQGYTFAESGTYFISVRGDQHLLGGREDLGAYILRGNFVANDPLHTPLVVDGGPANGSINYENDKDLFVLTVDADDAVHVSLTKDASITSLNFGVNVAGVSRSSVPTGTVYHFPTAGTYYFYVESPYREQSGAYTVTATTYADDHRSDVATAAEMAVGGPAFVGNHEYREDHDWVAIELDAGEVYSFSVTGLTGGQFNGSIDVYNASGVKLDSTGFNMAATTQLLFLAETTGVYYLGVWAQKDSATYSLTAAEFTPPLIETIDTGVPAVGSGAFGHSHAGAANVINLYFGQTGDEFGAIVSDDWLAEEIDAVMTVLSAFETYLNIDFQITDFLPHADIVLTTFDNPASVTTFQRADWDVPIPVIGFSHSSPLWTPEALTPGGLGAAFALNVIGYALGLGFAHAAEGDSYGMDGVTGPYDLGDYDLNQGVFTIMSFNDGWATSPFGLPGSDAYGWQATPMALDLAVLQAMYGANMTANANATTYTLGDANASGAAWRAIWDTGGSDNIQYIGLGDATIDLRAATLQYQAGGAGYLSYVSGVYGGFTIAHGVVIENATGGGGNDTLTGNSGVNVLIGNDGADVLNGMTGNDQMIGGGGNDSYYVDSVSDTVTETTGNGTDAVYTSLTYILGANVENLTLTGGDAINGRGNALNNVITGNSAANALFGFDGDDILNGGAGADTMYGAQGNDIYYVDNTGDIVFEAQPAWGTDLVYASVTYTLGLNTDNLTLTGTSNLRGNGNDIANTIIGNTGVNTLYGYAGNDVLNGGVGADKMYGGEGDDAYYVDNVSEFLFENQVNWGVDTAYATVGYWLGQNIDNLVIQAGAGAIYGRGNEIANTITGNESANSLYGFQGNDVLNGGVGADKMYGQQGDDTYHVDNAADVAFEAQAGWGVDTVYTAVNYELGANLEHLVLTGAALNGRGNAGDNTITGNANANRLNGQLGNDTIIGGVGDDVLIGGGGDDAFVFSLGDGDDTINDFIAGGAEDSIDLSAYDGSGVTWTVDQAGQHTVFNFSNGDSITLLYVNSANLVQEGLFGYS